MFEKLFSYDSVIYQTLLKITKTVLLNLLFLLCCMPIVTIGAAQAGMMNACRVARDPDDNSSWFQAFFRGFRSGFFKITVIWVVSLGLLLALGYALYVALCFDAVVGSGPVLPAGAGIAIVLLLQTAAVSFHSRFDCPMLRILRNGWFLLIMHPLRTIAATLITWLPLVLLFWDTEIFVMITPLWLFVYYGIAYRLNAKLMYKPFQKIEEQLVPAEE